MYKNNRQPEDGHLFFKEDMLLSSSMSDKNYKIPLNPEHFIKGNSHTQMCDTVESIARNLMLLITTRKQENRYDENYGNAVWDIEFENAKTTVEWEDIFIKSLQEQIQAYEPRLMSVKVQIHIVYVEHTYQTRKFTEIKRKAKIAVNAKLVETGEPFHFTTEIFLSPMSVD
ncbi:GPW/gp25 family protein [Capnocytophaga canis]|uniref:GPW/gp25 family protein n=1 Tax=Capnocytophaga canis TaxID=1848903 RepID=UPI001F50F5ED|nr:GPW/gp25 family protein [Capnocytophaga canis]